MCFSHSDRQSIHTPAQTLHHQLVHLTHNKLSHTHHHVVPHINKLCHGHTSPRHVTHSTTLSHTSTVPFYDGQQDDDDKEEECHVKSQPHSLLVIPSGRPNHISCRAGGRDTALPGHTTFPFTCSVPTSGNENHRKSLRTYMACKLHTNSRVLLTNATS